MFGIGPAELFLMMFISSFIWIAILAAIEKQYVWAIFSLLIAPVAIIYALKNKNRCWPPLLLITVALIFSLLGTL